MSYEARIKRIIGQLEALARLSGEGQSNCDQTLQQIAAVQGAVASLKRQVIDDSIEVCMDSRHPEKATKKLITSIRRYI